VRLLRAVRFLRAPRLHAIAIAIAGRSLTIAVRLALNAAGTIAIGFADVVRIAIAVDITAALEQAFLSARRAIAAFASATTTAASAATTTTASTTAFALRATISKRALCAGSSAGHDGFGACRSSNASIRIRADCGNRRFYGTRGRCLALTIAVMLATAVARAVAIAIVALTAASASALLAAFLSGLTAAASVAVAVTVAFTPARAVASRTLTVALAFPLTVPLLTLALAITLMIPLSIATICVTLAAVAGGLALATLALGITM